MVARALLVLNKGDRESARRGGSEADGAVSPASLPSSPVRVVIVLVAPGEIE